MRRAERLLRIALAGLVVVLLARGRATGAEEAAAPPAAAELTPAPDAPPASGLAPAAEPARAAAPRRFGVGWAFGNGMGPLGADVAVRVAPRLVVDVQLSYAHQDTNDQTTRAVAPIVRAYLHPDGPSAFLAAGASLAWKSAATDAFASAYASWFAYGVFVNVGHEWRWPSGLGIRLGAGIAWAPAVTVGSGDRSFEDDAFLGLNLEAGVQYMFL